MADEPRPAALPASLASAEALRARVARALHAVQEEDGRSHANVTDPEATRVRGREGVVRGYNAQAVVSPIKAAYGSGMLITAAAVSAAPHDYHQLLPMVAQAQENSGEAAGTTLADGGYHSGQNLRECAAKGWAVLMPEAQSKALEQPYHKEHFTYEAAEDIYRCPEGERLTYRRTRQRGADAEVRVYRAQGGVCRACPAFGQCTRNGRQGRELTVGPYEGELRAHRAVMAQEEARAQCRRRQGTVEPVFGILKDVQGARTFLSRGLEKVGAEWCLLAAAFNLRTLARLWARGALTLV